MGEIHDTLETDGKQAALRHGWDRREVEAASTYMAEEETGVGFLYSGWCQAGLPHRQLPANKSWQIISDHITLIVDPGSKPGPTEPIAIGVPYGSRARLIMLYLQSEALRTGRREVELGGSMREWLQRMGIPPGGKSYALIREQSERISRCRLSFNIYANSGKSMTLMQQNIVDQALFLDYRDTPQGTLFPETARLSEGFFAQLQQHPVPLEEAAIRAINNNSLALDIYAWLAYRLHALKSPTPIGWRALKGQFGSGFTRLDNFRTTFLTNLHLALAVYPKARVETHDDGLVLYNSPPPVSKKLVPGKVHTPAKVHTAPVGLL
jgi:hypothetical protein